MFAPVRRYLEAVVPDVSHAMVGRRCLVLAPHPDDEVLGCGGTMAQKVQRGEEVWVSYLTDGRMGIAGAPEWAPAKRRSEVLAAAKILGLPGDRLMFLDLPDGQLGASIREATAHVRSLIAALAPQDLFVPYQRDYHPDHLAAWRIAHLAANNHVRIYEYPIWYGPWLWRDLGWPSRVAAVLQLRDVLRAVKVNVTMVAEIKQRALAAYRSQVSALEQRPGGGSFLENFAADYELFFTRR